MTEIDAVAENSAAPVRWRNRIIGVGEEAPDQLLANPRNFRIHPKAQQDAMEAVLDSVGFVQHVIVNQRTGFVVDGHLRVSIAISRDETRVPVVYVDLSDDEEQLILTTFDPIGAMAGTDREKLTELLGAVRSDDARMLELLGSIREKSGIVDTATPGRTDPDEAPAKRASTKVKPGDLFQLGRHRLLCGDSTNPSDIDRVTSGSIDLLFTDPPYGVAYQTQLSTEEAEASKRRRDGLEVANDDLGEAETRSLVATALRLALERLKPGGVFYVCAPSGMPELNFRLALVDAGCELRQVIAWVKDVFVMGRQDYHWRHETILYGWRDGAAHYFVKDRTQDTVWNIDRPKRSDTHPTMKPVELVQRAIQNSSRDGELVCDLFAGSGTTLIACEQLGRRCAAIEIDPGYCQVIIDRWEAFSGQRAERIDRAKSVPRAATKTAAKKKTKKP